MPIKLTCLLGVALALAVIGAGAATSSVRTPPASTQATPDVGTRAPGPVLRASGRLPAPHAGQTPHVTAPSCPSPTPPGSKRDGDSDPRLSLLRGDVVDGWGRPLADVPVFVDFRRPRDSYTGIVQRRVVLSDGYGRFRARVPPPSRRVRIRVASKDLWGCPPIPADARSLAGWIAPPSIHVEFGDIRSPGAPAAEGAAKAEGSAHPVLRLERAQEIHGTVRGATGEPAAGVRVEAAWHDAHLGRRTRATLSGNDGRYTLAVPRRLLQVDVGLPPVTPAPLRLCGNARRGHEPPRPGIRRRGLLIGRDDFDLQLPRPVCVTGFLALDDGTPLTVANVTPGYSGLPPRAGGASAQLELETPSGESSWVMPTLAGEDGTFRVGCLAPGRYVLRARVEGEDGRVFTGRVEVVAPAGCVDLRCRPRPDGDR